MGFLPAREMLRHRRNRLRVSPGATNRKLTVRPLLRKWFSAKLLAIVNNHVENFARGRYPLRAL